SLAKNRPLARSPVSAPWTPRETVGELGGRAPAESGTRTRLLIIRSRFREQGARLRERGEQGFVLGSSSFSRPLKLSMKALWVREVAYVADQIVNPALRNGICSPSMTSTKPSLT